MYMYIQAGAHPDVSRGRLSHQLLFIASTCKHVFVLVHQHWQNKNVNILANPYTLILPVLVYNEWTCYSYMYMYTVYESYPTKNLDKLIINLSTCTCTCTPYMSLTQPRTLTNLSSTCLHVHVHVPWMLLSWESSWATLGRRRQRWWFAGAEGRPPAVGEAQSRCERWWQRAEGRSWPSLGDTACSVCWNTMNIQNVQYYWINKGKILYSPEIFFTRRNILSISPHTLTSEIVLNSASVGVKRMDVRTCTCTCYNNESYPTKNIDIHCTCTYTCT